VLRTISLQFSSILPRKRFLFLFSLMLVHSAVRLSSHASSSFNELSAIIASCKREQGAAARASPHKRDHARVENIELIVIELV
jgi:hypothetical protein